MNFKINTKFILYLLIFSLCFLNNNCHCHIDGRPKKTFFLNSLNFNKVYFLSLNITKLNESEKNNISRNEKEFIRLNRMFEERILKNLKDEKIEYIQLLEKDINELESIISKEKDSLFLILNLTYLEGDKKLGLAKMTIGMIAVAALVFGLIVLTGGGSTSGLAIGLEPDSIKIEFYAKDNYKNTIREKILDVPIDYFRVELDFYADSLLYDFEIPFINK